MIIVHLITLIGVVFTLFIIYSLINFYFGPQLRTYIQHKKELREAYKELQEHNDKRALRFAKKQARKRKEEEYLEAEEVEGAEVNTSSLEFVVYYKKQLGNIEAYTELIAADND